MWAPHFPIRPLADKFLYMALVHLNAYKCAKFKLPSSISLWDKEGVPKFNVGATSPLPYPVRWNFYVCSKYLARANSAPNFGIITMHHAVMQICISHRLPLYVPKRHYPAWIRICWCIACKIGSTAWALGWLNNFAYKEIKKAWVVTLAIWGEVTPGVTLTKCGVWGDMVDVITSLTCAIFGDCCLRGVGVVRGVNLPSPMDLMRRSTTQW